MSSRLIILIIGLTFLHPVVPVRGQGAESEPESPVLVDASLASPRATLRAFIKAMREQPPDLDQAVTCFEQEGLITEKAGELANDLYRSLNRIEWIEWDDPSIPDRTLLEQQPTGLTRWQYFPRLLSQTATESWVEYRARSERLKKIRQRVPDASIVLTKGSEGNWRFSRETITGIEDLWEGLRDLAPVEKFEGTEVVTLSERIEKLWPQSMIDRKFLAVKHWQWVSLFILIIAGVILDFTVRAILTGVSIRVIRRRGGNATSETLRKTVRPFGLAAAALLWLWTFHLVLPVAALLFIAPAVKFFAMLALVWAAFRVTDLVGEVAISKAEHTRTKFDDLLIPLVKKAVKIFIFIFGLIYLASALNIPLAPLLTGLGIGGAGFAFAAKDTLEHFFGSVTVIADRPFEVGDWVQIGDVEGTVEELGFRSTRVRTFYNSLVTVPNGNLVRAVVDNYGRRKYRRWNTHLNLTYDTPPDRIEAFCEGVRELIRLHPYTRKDYYQVWLHQFGAHSLDVLMYVFFEAPDWTTELRERNRLMIDVLRLADQLGVSFAFPTQTLHVFKEEHDQSHEPEEHPDADVDRRAKAIGKRAVRALVREATWRTETPGPYEFEYADPNAPDDDEETQIESKIGGDA